MKFKYFLRGLGAGIVFSAIIMFAAYNLNGSKVMTDKEIIEKAKDLGMVEKESSILVSSDENTSETTTEKVTTEKITTEKATTEKVTTEKVTTEETTTEETTTEETTTEEATTENVEGDYVEATISVTAGMGSYEVAVLLQRAGIIKDANDFDAYLNANGFSTKIRIKSEKFNNKMTYEEIAKLLIKEE